MESPKGGAVKRAIRKAPGRLLHLPRPSSPRGRSLFASLPEFWTRLGFYPGPFEEHLASSGPTGDGFPFPCGQFLETRLATKSFSFQPGQLILCSSNDLRGRVRFT